jgi:hypothetical protein
LVNTIEIKEYPQCCGMYILTNFFRNVEPVDPNISCCKGRACKSCLDAYQISLKAMESDDLYHKRIRDETIKHVKAYIKRKAYLLATLNEKEEQAGIGDILREIGFTTLLPMTKNPTGTSIVSYSYDLRNPLSAEVIEGPKKPVKSVIKKSVRSR